MTANVLVLTRDPALGDRMARTLHRKDYQLRYFAEPSSAFLWACGRMTSLAAAVIDDAIGPDETTMIVRRLRLLRPDLPTVVVTRDALENPMPAPTGEESAAAEAMR